MVKYKQLTITLLSFVLLQSLQAQSTELWNNKKCAVVLTYDDALNVHLDNVVPSLDSFGLKGTFYVVGASSVISKRIPEWRLAANNGHELGNHTLNHPCDGSLQGRSWVSSENDLAKFSLNRAINEIRITNTLLQAIDNKTERTFAFPCGDNKINNISYYKSVENEFVAARGVQPGLQHINEIALDNIYCYGINGQKGDYLIDLVKKAMESHTLLVFLFHGVGGEHDLNVSLEAHKQLLVFLKQHEMDIWNAPLTDVAKFIRKSQTVKK